MTGTSTDMELLKRAARLRDLDAANELLNGYGVERVTNDLTGRSIGYVNLGDIYATTICSDGRRYWVGDWGGWYEAQDAKAARAGLFRCAYCGAANQRGRRARHNFYCEECDNLVLGG